MGVKKPATEAQTTMTVVPAAEGAPTAGTAAATLPTKKGDAELGFMRRFIGQLDDLPNDAARARVLRYVADRYTISGERIS